MGAFYCSINVRCDNQQAVSEIWKALWKPEVACFISPCQNGWVSIFPDQCDADAGSAAISQRMNTSVLCLHVHDSDVFDYSYYKNGQEIDSFCSNPDYFNDGSDDAEKMREMLANKREEISESQAEKFQQMIDVVAKFEAACSGGNTEDQDRIDPEKVQGRPELLAELLTRPDDLEKLKSTLDRMRLLPLCEDNADDVFCELLGLDGALNGYSYIQKDGFDDEEGFIHILPKRSPSINSLHDVNKRNMTLLIRQFQTDPRHGPAVAFNQAAGHNLPDEINRMLDEGIDVNIQDQNGNTALHWATNTPTTKVMKLLFKRGANPNIRNNRGETALHRLFPGGLSEKKAFERAKIFLSAGADPTVMSEERRTPIDLAAERGYDSIVQCFKDHLSQKQE